jgi:pyruvate ferredoxin oxidoreductase beta subunit
MAHGIPYVATASVADLRDLEEKVERHDGEGARYIHVLVPCPLGWGAAPHDTIKLARLAVETGLFPLFEAEHGEVRARRSATACRWRTTSSRRSASPTSSARRRPSTRIARIQEMADRNIRKYRLVDERRHG